MAFDAGATVEEVTAADKGEKPSCGICLEAYREPKLLPCCHTFCKSCLDHLVKAKTKAKKGDRLKCPKCRMEHEVPDNGTEGFLTDYSLATSSTTELNHRSSSGSKSGRKGTVCGECDGGELVVAYCHDCEAFVCESCKVALHKAKRYRDHSIESLSEDDVSRNLTTNRSVLVSFQCPIHAPEKQHAFCKTCQCLVCVHCIVGSHQNHQLRSIDDATRTEVEEQLKTLKGQGEEKMANFEQHLRQLKSVEALVSERPKKLQSAINSAIDASIAQLEKRRKNLLQEVQNNHETNMKQIWSEKDVVKRVTVGLKSAIDFSEKVLQCSSNSELLCLAPQVCSRLLELHSQNWTPDGINHIKRTSYHFKHWEIAPSLKKFGALNTRTHSTTIIEGVPPNVELGKQMEIKVTEKDAEGCEIWSTEHSLKVAVTYGQIEKVKALQPRISPDGEWIVPFTPTCGGRHVISVTNSHPTITRVINVVGLPPTGSKVIRGPDFHYMSITTPQSVRECYSTPVQWSGKFYTLSVEYSDGKYYTMQWGDNDGAYDVELDL